MKYRIDMADSLVILEWIEAPSLEDLVSALHDIRGDTRFRQGSRLMIADAGTDFNPPFRTVDIWADLLRRFEPQFGKRIAYVAPNDIQYGIGRMLEVLCEHRGLILRVFRTRDDAREWLQGP